jgi:hypothetical protein
MRRSLDKGVSAKEERRSNLIKKFNHRDIPSEVASHFTGQAENTEDEKDRQKAEW